MANYKDRSGGGPDDEGVSYFLPQMFDGEVKAHLFTQQDVPSYRIHILSRNSIVLAGENMDSGDADVFCPRTELRNFFTAQGFLSKRPEERRALAEIIQEKLIGQMGFLNATRVLNYVGVKPGMRGKNLGRLLGLDL